MGRLWIMNNSGMMASSGLVMPTRMTGILYITIIVVGGITAISYYGPFNVELHQINTCEDEGTGQVHFDTKIRYAGGGNHIYNSTFYLQLPIDEHYKMRLDCQSWSSQGWRRNAFTWTANGCKQLLMILGNFYRGFLKSAGLDFKGCPIPAGNYTPKNWVVDLKFDSMPVTRYDKYKCFAEYFYKDVKTGCLILYLDTVPRRVYPASTTV